MTTNLFIRRPAFEWAVLLIIVGCGLLLRVGFYSIGRPVWLDESALALNVVEKSVSQGFLSLDASNRVSAAAPADDSASGDAASQACPIGYFILLKASQAILGQGPGPLRLVALLASALFLLLAMFWVRREFEFKIGAVTLLLLAFSAPLIEYATEIKQYEWEATVNVALLCFINPKRSSWKNTVWWGGLGAVAVWLSFSSIFVLAGIGLALLAVRDAENRKINLLQIGPVFAAWFLSFVLYYALSLRHLHSDQALTQFFSDAFAPFPPYTFAHIKWYVDSLISLVESTVGWEFRWGALGALLFGLGAFGLFKKNKSLTLALAGALMAVLAACMAGKYPWAPRLLLFLAPNTAALIATEACLLVGILYKQSKASGWFAGLIICIALIPSGLRPLRAAKNSTEYKYHDVPRLLDCVLPKMGSEDVLYLYKADDTQFLYYSKIHHLAPLRYFYGTIQVDESPEALDRLAAEIAKAAGGRRCWVILSHTDWNSWRLAVLERSLADRGGRNFERTEIRGAVNLKCEFK